MRMMIGTMTYKKKTNIKLASQSILEVSCFIRITNGYFGKILDLVVSQKISFRSFYLVNWFNGPHGPDEAPGDKLEFAPISCEVVNAANTEEVYTLWDSTDDVMCNNQHPVNFMINRNPMKSSDEWFYGLSYKGKHL